MSVPPIDGKVGRQKYSYAGRGLLMKGHAYSNFQPYLPRLEPLRTKKEKVAFRQPEIPRKIITWWRVQCALRGISPDGTIDDIQKRLRSAGNKPMLPELKDLERRLEAEYRPKVEAAHLAEQVAQEEKWRNSTMAEKADANPKRFLEEQFPVDQKKDEAISVTLLSRHKLQEAATAYGLMSSYREVGERYNDRLVVIGRSQGAIDSVLQSFDRERRREQQRQEEEEEAEMMEQHRDVLRSHGKKKEWDVTGSWKISCDAIEGQWDDCDDLTLEIYRAKCDGKMQMFAEFDFGIVSGIFRFEKLVGSKATTSKAKLKAKSKTKPKAKVIPKGKSKGKKNIVEEDSENDDSFDSESEDDSAESPFAYTPTSFFLPATAKPTPGNPTWNFRWRGSEREGPICLNSDEVLYSITFGEPKGTKLSGTFGGGCWGKCKFTGVKVEMGSSWKFGSVEGRWERYSRAAYEDAEKSRWR
ncbi:hypothetical protein G7Y89_g6113 [Cudoniella acicularis]|uniref:Uncharacterized protein n=1 Tax=Cudoniella acicularis TaxID=354080 RepID=A0A8H4RLY8_9HELO|nr:hypothetical protein G7Y89_g6113 [Cudoniella acicularis]